jgi:hypothetical protein
MIIGETSNCRFWGAVQLSLESRQSQMLSAVLRLLRSRRLIDSLSFLASVLLVTSFFELLTAHL